MRPYLSGDKLIISGEMEIRVPCLIDDAYPRMVEIACASGYLVGRKGRTIIHVSGGDIPGYVALDWFEPGREGPVCIEVWTATSFYLDKGKLLTAGEYVASTVKGACHA